MGGQQKKLPSFLDLIEHIADNKFVLGDRLVEVGFSGPNLEATHAAIAMAQGELGHARNLYNWTAKLQGKPIRDIKSQTGKALNWLVQIEDWIQLIAGLYTANIAHGLLLEAVLETEEEAVSRIHKLTEEQKEHMVYSREWVNQLLQEEGAIPGKFLKALSETAAEVANWLRKVDETGVLATERGDRLEEKFNQAIHRNLEAQGATAHAGSHS